jgi:hypothetical protein
MERRRRFVRRMKSRAFPSSLFPLPVFLVIVALSCAKLGAPPGGPLRIVPPELLRVTPDSGSVNVRTRGVMFEFDVVTNDRSSGPAGGDLDNLFLLSPQDGRPRVIWRRDRIEVRPRRGFLPNTAYSVTMLPGIADLRGNVMRVGATTVFSTGPTIPGFFVRGRVFDWVAERPPARALIDLYRLPDSLHYVAATDSTGQFAAGPLVEGSYVLRAIVDANNNRALDVGELWDSLAVAVRGSTPFVELLAIARDTVAPRLLTVNATDTLTLAASFDRALDPNVPVTPASFQVQAADSTRLRIRAVRSRAQQEALRQARDSARDTTRADTTRADTARAARPRPPLPAPPPPAVVPPVIEARPSRPPPARDFVIELDSATAMRPGTNYRVTAVNARGLLGHTRTSDRVITMPLPRPPAQRDTTRRPP